MKDVRKFNIAGTPGLLPMDVGCSWKNYTLQHQTNSPSGFCVHFADEQ